MPISKTALSAVMLALLSFPSFAQEADILLSGGKILIVDSDFTSADSLAIKDGRILAVGSAEDVAPHRGDDTDVIELAGRTVIPGLIDNHVHFIRSAWNYQVELRLDGVTSRTEALASLKAKAAASEPGQWLTVIGGWHPAQFKDDNSDFTLAELDAVSNDHPVFLLRSYGNGFANSAAFEAVGKTTEGEAVILGREAMAPFTQMISWRNQTSSRAAIVDYMAALNAVGLTTVYDPGRASDGNLEPLAALAAEGPMPLRVFHTLRYNARDAASAADAMELIENGPTRPLSNDLQYGVIGLGEHIYTPVSDNPRRQQSWDEEHWTPFADISWAAARAGWPVHEHVMSQVTAHQYLDLIEAITAEVPELPALRWTLAHANGMTDADIERAARLGVAIAVHSQARMSLRTMDMPRVGSIARSGALWGLGTDGAIVSSYSPFATLEWVVAGTNIAGDEGWADDQRVSREVAFAAHTRQNAALLFMEDDLGTLEVGKLADLVVLDQDIMTVSEDDISEIRPVMTMTGGEIVYRQSAQ